MSSGAERKILQPGKVLGHYSILGLIGQGGYGDIYEAVDEDTLEHCALKVERIAIKKQALQKELNIIEHLRSPYFPKFVCYEETSKFRYMAIELCGPSFSTVRRMLPGQRFSLSTVLRSGIEMLRAIEAFHEHGFLHRDIKPSNFLIRPSRRYPLALIDYGLSRLFMDTETGRLVQPRDHPGFVGTSKYASVNAHAGSELGRRDDLYSWFFSMFELWAGQLPWSQYDDKQTVYGRKCSVDITCILPGMPEGLKSVYKLIRRLNREETPNYKLLTAFLVDAMREADAAWADPYEWEHIDVSSLTSLTLRPPDGDETQIPDDLPEPVMPARVFVPFAADPQRQFDARMQGQIIMMRKRL
jgi:serine/threonine protein kinase